MRIPAHRFFTLALAMGALAASLAAARRSQTASSRPARAKTVSVASLTVSQLALRKTYGSPGAPITMEVFSDYQCPHCREFYEGPAAQMMQDYVNTGKVYLVHHDFPMPGFAHSMEAAHWADAAAAAGIFPAVDQALYATQDDWGATGKIDDSLAKVLSTAMMSKLRAAESAPHPEFDTGIAQDQSLGRSKGVNGTPGIFVTHNGQTVMLPGVPSYALLKAYLDSLLQH